MIRARLRWFGPHWLAHGLMAAGCSLVAAGCSTPTVQHSGSAMSLAQVDVQPILTLVPPAPKPAAAPNPIQQVSAEALPAPQSAPPSAVAEVKALPISLDTVLRLAEENNSQLALARSRLAESEAEQCLAAKAWLPQVSAGVYYYRHEGGIQEPDGTEIKASSQALFGGLELHSELDLREATFQRVNAERKMWQQRGEVSRVTSETLLEAATTYLDLLTARRAEAVGHELEKFLLDLQARVEKMVTPQDQRAASLLEGLKVEVAARRQTLAKLHQQGDAAAAKLVYLLHLGGGTQLVPVEEALTPVELVDPTPPAADLVTRALTSGPGVQELERLIATLESGLAQAMGPGRLMPILSMSMAEGGYGAGPGSQMSFDNRWDAVVGFRWNLTELATARDKRRLAELKIEQARLTQDDLRGKLTAGVTEAREAILSGRQQVLLGRDQIEHAAKAYQLSDKRLKENVPGATAAEVLLTVHGLEAAHTNYLTALNAHNKAQIRLLMLLGPANACGTKP